MTHVAATAEPSNAPFDGLHAASAAESTRALPRSADAVTHHIFVDALAWIRQAEARANAALARLDGRTAWAIERAAAEVIQGFHDDQFAQTTWQVQGDFDAALARRASQLIRTAGASGRGAGFGSMGRVDRDALARLGQSSTDAMVMALQVTMAVEIADRVLPALARMRRALRKRTVGSVRTRQNAAAPAQHRPAHAAQLEAAEAAIGAAMPALHRLHGAMNDPQLAGRVGPLLAASLGRPFELGQPADSRSPAPAAVIAAHAALRNLAGALIAMAADFPRHPAAAGTDAGNDVMTWLRQVIAHDVTLNLAVAEAGAQRIALPLLIVRSVLQSLQLMGDVLRDLCTRAEAMAERSPVRVREQPERSLMLVAALVPHVGYATAAEIARRAQTDHTTLRDAAIALGVASPVEFDRWVQDGDSRRVG